MVSIFWVFGLIGGLGCATENFGSVLRSDDPSTYYWFIKNHPESEHVEKAKERLAYHETLRAPTLVRFERFKASYPDSESIAELRSLVEPEAFTFARGLGTPEAYANFVENFPDAGLAARAEGNAEYESADGFLGRLTDLAEFASDYPESDFAAEARRSVDTLLHKQGEHYERVALLIEVDPFQPQRDRIVAEFEKRAGYFYQSYGVGLYMQPDALTSRDAAIAADDPDTLWLVLRHSEGRSTSELREDGSISGVRHEARTTVSLVPDLAQRDELDAEVSSNAIWEREFVLSLRPSLVPADSSPLFGDHSASYWAEWFVPVASWNTGSTVRRAMDLERTAVDVDAARGRVAVLLEGGEVRVIELADPEKPVVLGGYTPAPLEHGGIPKNWSGIRIHDRRVILFGSDGYAVLSFVPNGAEMLFEQSSDGVGELTAVEPVGANLLLAGSNGLLLTQGKNHPPKQLVARPVYGMAIVGDTLLFVDQTTLFVTTVAMLQDQQVQAQLDLGEDFLVGAALGSGRIRGFEGQAVIFGATGTLVVDLSTLEQPRLVASFTTTQTGQVTDAAQIGGHTFLFGRRGIQKLGTHNNRIVESIHISARGRLVRMGRHLVAVGGEKLQVVDASPYIATGPLPIATWNIEEDRGDEVPAAGSEVWAASDESDEPAVQQWTHEPEVTTEAPYAEIESDEIAIDHTTEEAPVEELAEQDLGDVEGWSSDPAPPVADVPEITADDDVVTEWSEENLAAELGAENAIVKVDPIEAPQAEGWNAAPSATEISAETAPSGGQWSTGNGLDWSADDAKSIDDDGSADLAEAASDSKDEAGSAADALELEVASEVDGDDSDETLEADDAAEEWAEAESMDPVEGSSPAAPSSGE